MGGAKRDVEPVGHVTASPHQRREIAWGGGGGGGGGGGIIVEFIQQQQQQDNSTDHGNDWQSPKKMKKNENQDFYGCQHFEMSIVIQRTYFGSHRVNI